MSDFIFGRYRDLVEEHLLDYIPEIDNKSITLYDSMKYSLSAGGKRIRPMMVLAACEFAGGNMMEALPYACAIEYIHTYSLIHDDLPAMDDDDYRRGNPTNHKVYGEATAILAGDGLLTTAFEIMNKDMMMYFDNPDALKRRVRAAYELAKGAGVRGMVAGQIGDMEAEGHSCSAEMLDYININKTGALLVAALRMGASIGGGNPDVINDLTHYGEHLGLLFQITDDMLDVVGNAEELGKATGADAKQNKSTYVSVYGLEKTKERANELASKARANIAKYYDNAEFFNELVNLVLTRTY